MAGNGNDDAGRVGFDRDGMIRGGKFYRFVFHSFESLWDVSVTVPARGRAILSTADGLIKEQLARCAKKFRETCLVPFAIRTLQLFRHEVIPMLEQAGLR